jgi:hypothetical protein
MKNELFNSKGFAAFVLPIALAAVLIVGGGAYVYHKNHTTKDSTDKTVSTKASTQTSKSNTPNPYAGWDSYTTKYDKLSFKYPTNWTLTDNSTTDDTDVTPGQDSVTLTSGDSLQVVIGTGGTDYLGGNPNTKVLSAIPVSMLGGTHYLVFGTSSSDDTTGGAVVTTTNAVSSLANLPTSKNIHLSSTAVSGLPTPFDLIDVHYSATSGSDVEYPFSKFQQDPNYKTALNILSSISY